MSADAGMREESLGLPLAALASLDNETGLEVSMRRLLTCLVVCSLGTVGCGSPSADDSALPDVADTKGDTSAQLVSVQINDTHDVLGEHHIGYTGHPRYTGAFFEAKRGQIVSASAQIAQELHPIIAMTDAKLTVLSKVTGGTIAGGPGTSSAFLQFVIPADGRYWLLFSEAQRTSATIDTKGVVLSEAGSPCHQGPECMSGTCTGDVCGLTHAGAAHGLCSSNADCTTAVCLADLVCQPSGLSGVCQIDDDCSSQLCVASACACFQAGHVIADVENPVRCCSARAVAGADGHLACTATP
jgi:hypothetical protein